MAGGAALILCALALTPLWLRSQPQERLVLVFVFDALRADHLTQYGYSKETSPGLAQLAQVSTIFENAYAPSSHTTPSTASLLTGLSPVRHGATRQGAPLDPDHFTIAELFHSQGYTARGLSFNPVVADATGFTQGFSDFFEREAGSPFNLYPDIRQGLERIRDWLGDPSAPAQFIYFQAMNTHGPYLVPKPARTTLLGRAPSPEFRYYEAPMGRILSGDLSQRAEVNDRYVESAIEHYDTAIRYSTDQLGAFLAELDQQGRFDGALIIVTADHGDEFFEHGGFSHGYTLHEEVVRVPLFVKLPGQTTGQRISERVGLVDLLPTLSEWAGANAPPDLDGRSLMPLIQRQAGIASPSHPLHLNVDFPPRLVAKGLIQGPHKLIAVESNYEGVARELRLYDLAADPEERSDIAGSHPALAQRLLQQLLAHTRSEAQNAPAPAAPVSELDRELLEALGYIE